MSNEPSTPAPTAGATQGDHVEVDLDGRPLPTSIGPYRVIRLLGQGGMGQVYECEQASPQRRVALKVIRPGLGTGSILKRFEREADLLGRLQHPGIARIIEAGTADAGLGPQPYLAMEYVRGRPLNEYCRSRGLGTRQRLSLMKLVCEAVEHAHARGIIHRDLKPANILVDDAGQPHILDFGIATLTGPEHEQSRLTIVATGERALMGTLDYMSPEQATGDPRQVDARSDVYALGVILFELLTGITPHRLTDRPLPEAARMISQDDARRLATVNTRFRGDVDTIVSKALEKEPHRRYQSAAALGEDLARFLGEQPILARPASTMYQFKKFARRNRALVAGVALAFVGLSAGLAFSVAKAVEARTARVRAEQAADDLRLQLARSEQVVDLLNDAFRAITPDRDRGRDTTLLREVLSTAERGLAGLRNQPEIEEELRNLVGEVSSRISDFETAERNLRQAAQLARERGRGRPDASLALTLGNLSNVRWQQGYPDEALDLADQGLAVAPEGAAVERSYLFIARSRALLETARWDEAIASAQQGHEALEGLTGQRADDLRLNTLECMAGVYMRSDRAALAIPLFEQVVERRRDLLGADHPDVAGDLGNLALATYLGRDPETAERLTRECLELARRTLAEDSDVISNAKNTLGMTLAEQGRYDEAIPLFLERLAQVDANYGPQSTASATVLTNLGAAYSRSGDPAGAIPHLLRASQIVASNVGENTPQTGLALTTLASALRDAGRFREALDTALRASAALDASLSEGSPNRYAASLMSASCAFEVLWAERSIMPTSEALPMAERALRTIESFAAWRRTTVEEGGWAFRLVEQQEAVGRLVVLIARHNAAQVDAAAARDQLQAITTTIESHVEPLRALDADVPPPSRATVRTFGPKWLARTHEFWDGLDPGQGHRELAEKWQQRAAPSPPQPPNP